MKAWIFGPFKELKQGDVETLHIGKGGPNFGEAVEVLPAAVHDAEQAAIAAAEEALIDACETCRYSGDNRRMCESINCRWLKVKDARDELRAAKEAE
uniref:Uncharacterized protein n=1 Tax=viral metagenome TaxID=1070528 RepID=A0A6M3LW40_9ZZZZ